MSFESTDRLYGAPMDYEEARAHAERVPVSEWDVLSALEPHQEGQVVAHPTSAPGGWIFDAWFKPGFSEAKIAEFTEYVRQRVTMFLVIGPDADGWSSRSDGGWQITAAVVEAPVDPFL